mgnify:FL=1
MSIKDNGGPAFPMIRDMRNNPDWDHEAGMTLRDYFAAKAMQAIITKLPVVDREGEFGAPVEDKIKYNADIANSAYWIADAMLEERAK